MTGDDPPRTETGTPPVTFAHKRGERLLFSPYGRTPSETCRATPGMPLLLRLRSLGILLLGFWRGFRLRPGLALLGGGLSPTVALIVINPIGHDLTCSVFLRDVTDQLAGSSSIL
jgi:hypothetical protein